MTAATLQRSTPMAALSGKPRGCDAPGCKVRFVPTRPFQCWCSPECGLVISRLKLEKKALADAKAEKAARTAERQQDRAKKEKLKRLQDLRAEAQQQFNRYIRFRDFGKGCIDCGQPLGEQKFGGSYDAGHYLSRGSNWHLAFDERNVHAQRKSCNRPGGTTREKLRAGVVARIGLEAVEALEADQAPRRYRHDDYRQIRDTYRAKANELKRAQGDGRE